MESQRLEEEPNSEIKNEIEISLQRKFSLMRRFVDTILQQNQKLFIGLWNQENVYLES